MRMIFGRSHKKLLRAALGCLPTLTALTLTGCSTYYGYDDIRETIEIAMPDGHPRDVRHYAVVTAEDGRVSLKCFNRHILPQNTMRELRVVGRLEHYRDFSVESYRNDFYLWGWKWWATDKASDYFLISGLSDYFLTGKISNAFWDGRLGERYMTACLPDIWIGSQTGVWIYLLPYYGQAVLCVDAGLLVGALCLDGLMLTCAACYDGAVIIAAPCIDGMMAVGLMCLDGVRMLGALCVDGCGVCVKSVWTGCSVAGAYIGRRCFGGFGDWHLREHKPGVLRMLSYMPFINLFTFQTPPYLTNGPRRHELVKLAAADQTVLTRKRIVKLIPRQENDARYDVSARVICGGRAVGSRKFRTDDRGKADLTEFLRECVKAAPLAARDFSLELELSDGSGEQLKRKVDFKAEQVMSTDAANDLAACRGKDTDCLNKLLLRRRSHVEWREEVFSGEFTLPAK